MTILCKTSVGIPRGIGTITGNVQQYPKWFAMLTATTKYALGVMHVCEALLYVMHADPPWAYLKSDHNPRKIDVPPCAVRQLITEHLVEITETDRDHTVYRLSPITKLAIERDLY